MLNNEHQRSKFIMTSCNGKLRKLSLNGSPTFNSSLSEANFVIIDSLRGNGELGLVEWQWAWPLWAWPLWAWPVESS